jgi:hypothetical protein
MNLDRRSIGIAGAALAVAGLVLTVSPLHLAGGVVLVAGVVMLGLAEPDWALLAILVLFPIHPLAARVAQFDLGVTGPALSVFSAWKEAALAALVAGQLVRTARQRHAWTEIRPRLQVIDLVAVALVVLVALGLALRRDGLALNQARLWLFPIGVYLAVRLSGLPFRRYLEAAAVAAVGIGIFLVVESTFFGLEFVERYWTAPGQRIPYTYTAHFLEGVRGSGTLGSPNEAALALAIWACLLAAAVLVLGRWRGWFAVALGIVLVSMTVTFSRSAAPAVVLGVGAMLVAAARSGSLNPRRGVALLLVAVIAASSVTGVIYSQRGGLQLIVNTFATLSGETDNPDPSTKGHFDSLRFAMTEMTAHPLGDGLGTVGARADPITGERPRLIIESYYLTLGVTFGLVGLAWAMLLFLALAACALRAVRRGFVLAGLAALGAAVAAAAVSVLLPTMAEPQIAMLPWALGAFAAGPLFGAIGGASAVQPSSLE